MRLMTVFLLAALTGCAAAGTASRTDRSLLTFDEIHSDSYSNALDLITAKRPQWLRTRGPLSIQNPESSVTVYLDNARMGDSRTLASISLAPVQFIRHYTASEANLRYGTGHEHGVIFISTHPLR